MYRPYGSPVFCHGPGSYAGARSPGSDAVARNREVCRWLSPGSDCATRTLSRICGLKTIAGRSAAMGAVKAGLKKDGKSAGTGNHTADTGRAGEPDLADMDPVLHLISALTPDGTAGRFMIEAPRLWTKAGGASVYEGSVEAHLSSSERASPFANYFAVVEFPHAGAASALLESDQWY